MQEQVTLDMIRQAREAMKGTVEFTPIVTSTRVGKNLYIKSENLQKTGSFKIRGAFNKIRNLTPEEASRGGLSPAQQETTPRAWPCLQPVWAFAPLSVCRKARPS